MPDFSAMPKPPPVETDTDRSWTRAMLLRELRKPLVIYRWGWVGGLLWPLAAIFGVISYRGFTTQGWPAVNFGCALLSFNFAVSAVLNQVTAPLRRKIEILEALVDDPDDGPA